MGVPISCLLTMFKHRVLIVSQSTRKSFMIVANLRFQLYRPYIALLTAHSFCGDTGTRAAALQARAGTTAATCRKLN